MSMRDDLERRLDLAADLALRTRERIETGVRNGEVPSWVLDACNVLERASLQYGELAEQLKPSQNLPPEAEFNEPALALHSLTIH